MKPEEFDNLVRDLHGEGYGWKEAQRIIDDAIERLKL